MEKPHRSFSKRRVLAGDGEMAGDELRVAGNQLPAFVGRLAFHPHRRELQRRHDCQQGGDHPPGAVLAFCAVVSRLRLGRFDPR
jgi:hypothetical protein